MKKLSIIIPFYKTHEETAELLNVLVPQINDNIEVIVVNNSDNVSFRGVTTLFCESNGTASKPRNVGLDNAKGEYIAFIDSDDLVTENYIDTILSKIETSDFDYCFVSWTYMDNRFSVIIDDFPPSWNYSVWNCIYKRSLIGDTRFDESLRIAEDAKFNYAVRKGKKDNILDILYIYNTGREGNLSSSADKKEV